MFQTKVSTELRDFLSLRIRKAATFLCVLRFFCILLTILIFGACSRPPVPVAPVAPADSVYPVRGTVVSTDAARKSMRIAHEDIPGYMEAMTMEFRIATSSDAAEFKPGDVVTGTLKVSDSRSELAEVKKVGHSAAPVQPIIDGIPAVGSELPDAALIDDTGRAFRLSELRGKAVALTFIYTRCPLPDYCPRMNGNFAIAMAELPDERCAWLSITIDPANDSPRILAQSASQFQRTGRWKFATGSDVEITTLAKFSGLETRRDGLPLNHNLRTLVVAPDGKIAKVFTGNEWKPAELVAEMKRALR